MGSPINTQEAATCSGPTRARHTATSRRMNHNVMVCRSRETTPGKYTETITAEWLSGSDLTYALGLMVTQLPINGVRIMAVVPVTR